MLRQLREAKDELTDEEAHEALSEAAPTNGRGRGGPPGRGTRFLQVRRLLGAIEESGIVLRDIDSGLVDFPGSDRRTGRSISAGEMGEDDVAHWHDLESGYGGPRTARLTDSHRGCDSSFATCAVLGGNERIAVDRRWDDGVQPPAPLVPVGLSPTTWFLTGIGRLSASPKRRSS